MWVWEEGVREEGVLGMCGLCISDTHCQDKSILVPLDNYSSRLLSYHFCHHRIRLHSQCRLHRMGLVEREYRLWVSFLCNQSLFI